MNSPAHDVALLLQTLGVGTFAGTSDGAIYVAIEPATPNTVVTVYDTPGEEPDTDELDIFRPRIQVRVRAPSYPVAYTKQELIRDLLINTQPHHMATSRARIIMTSDIMSLGRDDSNRLILTANYRLLRSAL